MAGTVKPAFHRQSSAVGEPDFISYCLQNKIAHCDCVILQPTPEMDFPKSSTFPRQADGDRRPTLIPSGVRTLVLWKDTLDDEFHLTAVREEKDEVFLDLPLSGEAAGKISYRQDHALWHEVTVQGDPLSYRPPKKFIFNLQQSDDGNKDQAVDFSRKLTRVFQELNSVEEITGEDILPRVFQELNSVEENTGKDILPARFADQKTVDLFPPSLNFEVQKKEQGGLRNNEVIQLQQFSVGKQNVTQPLLYSTSLRGFPSLGRMSLPRMSSQLGPLVGAEAPLMAMGDFPSGLPSSRSSVNIVPLSPKDVELFSVELASAIAAGNEGRAKELVARLAQNQARLNVSYDAASEEAKLEEQEIGVTVHVEDRESVGLTLNDVKVRQSDTIADLKRMFHGKYGFPVEVQKWIIGNRICTNDETLLKCEVSSMGATLYLYLLSAKAVNLTREEYELRRSRSFNSGDRRSLQSGSSSGDYETMMMPIQSPVGPQSSTPQAGQDYALVPPPGQGQGQITPAGRAPTRQQSNRVSVGSSISSLANTSFGMSDLRNSDPLLGSSAGQGQEGRTRGGTLVASTGGPGGPPTARVDESSSGGQGWQCEQCTLINQPTRPGCEVCGHPRPPSYQVPVNANYMISDEERLRLEQEQQLENLMQQHLLKERESNYQRHLHADSSDLVPNSEIFSCPICFDDIPPGDGVVLRECLHQFCRSCLTEAVRLTEEAELKCPYQDERYTCNESLQEREVRGLVSSQMYERYLRRGLDMAESRASNSYHCKTPDCRGWCIYEDLVNFFKCPVCGQENCLTCRAIHQGMNCKQYQEDLKIRAANDEAAKQTQAMLQEMLDNGEAMHCPQCEVVVQKKDGCDWIKCSICKTEICWVTKGFRWGPNGEGDSSAGCKCRVGGKRCHPKCNNCH